MSTPNRLYACGIVKGMTTKYDVDMETCTFSLSGSTTAIGDDPFLYCAKGELAKICAEYLRDGKNVSLMGTIKRVTIDKKLNKVVLIEEISMIQ